MRDFVVAEKCSKIAVNKMYDQKCLFFDFCWSAVKSEKNVICALYEKDVNFSTSEMQTDDLTQCMGMSCDQVIAVK